jgi:hypothetical protein
LHPVPGYGLNLRPGATRARIRTASAAHVSFRFVASNPDVARYLGTFAAADLSLWLKGVQIGGL